MRILLLRHAATAGNLAGRYVGSTDEALCEEGRAQLASLTCPMVARVYCSPLRRCLDTAAALYPSLRPCVVPDFRECDFGAFENLSYRELNGRADYQAWIDSQGALPFPGGESREAFVRRCARAFDALKIQEDSTIIAHGGTLMAILSERAWPRGDYFSYQVKTGRGFLCDWDGCALTMLAPFQ